MAEKINRITSFFYLLGGELSHKILYEKIWNAFYPRLMIFTRNFGFTHSTEDILQDIFSKIWLKLDSYKTKYSMSTWIYSIARNHLKDCIKRKSHQEITLNYDDAGVFCDNIRQSPEEILLYKEKLDQLACWVEGLNPKDKNILYLKYYENLKIKEISQILEMPQGTVKYRIHEIKKRLKNKNKEAI